MVDFFGGISLFFFLSSLPLSLCVSDSSRIQVSVSRVYVMLTLSCARASKRDPGVWRKLRVFFFEKMIF